VADSTVTIGGDISDLQAKLKQAGTGVKSFGTQARSAMSGIDLGKAFATAGGIAGLTALVKVGFDFNQTMKDGEVAIANVLRTFKGLNGEAAKSEAARVVQLIAEAEPKAAGGLKELTQGFIASAAAAASAGLSVEENVDLVARFANALANSGLPLDQLNQEIRSVLTAQISGDSFVGKLLEGKGLGNARIKELSQQGKLYGELVKELGAMGEAGDTAGVAFSTLESALRKTAGYITAGMFDDAVKGAQEMSVWLDLNKELFTDLGAGISKTLGFLGNFASFMNDIRAASVEGIGGGIGSMLGLEDNNPDGFMDTFVKRRKDREAAMAKATAGTASSPGTGAAPAGAPAAASSSAPAAAKSLLSITREIEAVEKMREKLGERQFASLMRHLTPQLQIEAITKRINQALQDGIYLQTDASESTEADHLAHAERMLDLQDQLAAAKARQADAAAAAAEKEQAANDKLIAQAQSLADMQAQTEILKAQAGGDDKKAAALQRQAEIQAAVKNILDQTNLSEAEALRMAEEQQTLKEQIAANQKDGKGSERGKIDASIGEGGTEGARQRAQERLDRSRERSSDAMKKGFGSFGEEDARLRERFGKEFGPPGAPRQNPAALDAAKNAGGEAAGAANPQQQAGQQIVALVSQILEAVK
jgi:hypothetical protein